MRIAASSTEFVRIVVTAEIAGAAYDPTADAVAFAFTDEHSTPPASATWTAGSWDTGTAHVARCLVGPANGGLVLAAGDYSIWVRVTDNPEVPVLPAGTLTIY